MLCQHCKKNPATVHYSETVNGNAFECHLCASCYADLYGDLNNKFNNDIFAGLFGKASLFEKGCPVCGTTYGDYERSGLLGCASCYDVFKEELIPSIKQIQGKVMHVGKAGQNSDKLGLHRQLKDLQEKLEEALREKNFREAGSLNRQINSIKKAMLGGGGNG